MGSSCSCPRTARRTTGPSWPSATSSSVTSPPCEPRYGPDTVEGILDPALQAVRVKPVHEHETGDEFVGGEPIDQVGGRLGGDRDDPLERSPVEVGQLGGELFGPLTHDRSAARAGVQQGLDSITC